MSQAQTMEELAERADALVAEAMRIPPLDLVRGMLNEAGLPKARRVLSNGLLNLAQKQLDLRVALEEERDAKEALATAVTAAEWELDGNFSPSGNKTLLLVGYRCESNHPAADTPCANCEPIHKAMTADERAKWKATEAHKMPEVAAAAARLRSAEHDVAGYRDALVIAEKSLSAARADLDAAVAHLNALSLALPSRNGATK